MKLVIVETPAQAKQISDTLGEGWRVEPCYGFVRVLPADKLGVDVEGDFRPTFTITPGKSNLVRRLMKAVRESEAVYAATPPTRVGEMMAWHVLALSPDAKDKLVYRVMLTAFTPESIRAAFAVPHTLNMNWVETEVTKCILDRLVGWGVNAAARKSVGFKTALTYNGMAALRLLTERERHIAAHTPETRWRAEVTFESDGVRFTAQALNAKGAPLALRSADQAAQLEGLLKSGAYWVDKTGQAVKAHPAPPPLTLRRLVETAERELDLTPDRTLALVIALYEAGWITHPDGELPTDFSEAAKAYVRREYGTDYLGPDAVVSSGIAPADVNRLPEDLPGDGAALYGLIWLAFIAAHMTPAQERITAARILVGASQGKPYPLELRATAKRLYFDGWQRVLRQGRTDEVLPHLQESETLRPTHIIIEPVTSEALPRLTQAALVSAQADIGMEVSLAARAVDGLQAAGYTTNEEGALTLTESGRLLADYLAVVFADLTSPRCAAELAADLEQIAAGERPHPEVLRAFWARFGAMLHPVPAARAVGEHKPIVLRSAEEV